MHNERLCCLFCVGKLAPDHIKSTQGSMDRTLNCAIQSFHLQSVVVLGSSQSPLYDQNSNFQCNFKSKLGKPIPEER